MTVCFSPVAVSALLFMTAAGHIPVTSIDSHDSYTTVQHCGWGVSDIIGCVLVLLCWPHALRYTVVGMLKRCSQAVGSTNVVHPEGAYYWSMQTVIVCMYTYPQLHIAGASAFFGALWQICLDPACGNPGCKHSDTSPGKACTP